MATRYWIGNQGPVTDSARWSASNGNTFTAVRTVNSGPVTYSNLVGTIANGQSVFGVQGTEFGGASTFLGTVSSLNTTNKTFYLTGGGNNNLAFTAQTWCSGTGGASVPTSADTVIINERSGNLKIDSTSNSNILTYNTINFTGYTGTWVGRVNTNNLVVSPTMFFEQDLGYANFFVYGTGSTLSFAAGDYTQYLEIVIGTKAFTDYTHLRQTTSLNINSSLLSSIPETRFIIDNGTITTNNNNLNLSYIIFGNYLDSTNGASITFNAGSSVITGYFDTSGPTVPTINFTLNFNAGTSTISSNSGISNGYGSTLYNVVGSGNLIGSFTCNSLTWEGLVEDDISANTFVFNNVSIEGDVGSSLTKLGGGAVNSSYTTFTNITAYPANTFFASNSIDGGGNTNITFATNSFIGFF